MALRTSEVAVQGILETDSNISLTPFMTTANKMVDWLASVDEDSELSTDLLTEIETWLSAHFYSHRDQLLSNKSMGGASGTFQGQTGMFFSSTQYGQTAMMLDVTGRLAQREQEMKTGRMRPGVWWVGTEIEDEETL